MSENTQAQKLGGAFVLESPVALTFEELLATSWQRPEFPVGLSEETFGGDPLSCQHASTNIGVGEAIEKKDWYMPHENMTSFRLGASSSRRHMLYDVYFSAESIGLTLSYKEHVFVQALSGTGAKQLGIIAKGDIIVSAACSDSWIRCVSSLTELTEFIKLKGRPVLLRFWRRPEPVSLHSILQSPKSLEIFLNFINRYLESPNYQEIIRNERTFTDAALGGDDNDTDMESSEDEDEKDWANLAQKYLNSGMAQVMFLVEVVKIKKRANGSATSNMAVKNSVGAKYLTKKTSDFSIRDLFAGDKRTRLARKEVLLSGSLSSLDILYDHISERVRNDTFALFLHDQELETVLHLLGEKNAWKLRVYSYLVRVYVPLEVILNNRKTCSALVLFMQSLDASNSFAVHAPEVSLYNASVFCGNKAVQAMVSCVKGLCYNGNIAKQLNGALTPDDVVQMKQGLMGLFDQFHRQFFYSDMGIAVHEAFNQCIQATGGYSHIDEHMPKLSTLLRLSSTHALVIHRAMQTPPAGDPIFIKHGALFRSRHPSDTITDPFVIAELNDTPLPPQIERFFVPHGTDDVEGFVAGEPAIYNFVHGSGTYACTLVIPFENTSGQLEYFGACITSELRLLETMRDILADFFYSTPDMITSPEASIDSLQACVERQNTKVDVENLDPDFDIRILFEVLSLPVIIKLFECILLERKILMVSRKYSALTLVAETLKELIAPLQWCHVYAPVLPRKLLDHLECPTPFIIGINTIYAFKKDFPFVLDVVIVDLDTEVIRVPSETGPVTNHPPFPSDMFDSLLASLRFLTRPSFQGSDNVKPESLDFPNQEIRAVFKNVVAELVGDVVGFCSPVEYSENSVADTFMVFDEAKFLLSVPLLRREFYTALLRTQAFSTYVSSFL